MFLLLSKQGHTPLHKAIKYNKEEICIEVLNRGSKLGEIGENVSMKGRNVKQHYYIALHSW